MMVKLIETSFLVPVCSHPNNSDLFLHPTPVRRKTTLSVTEHRLTNRQVMTSRVQRTGLHLQRPPHTITRSSSSSINNNNRCKASSNFCMHSMAASTHTIPTITITTTNNNSNNNRCVHTNSRCNSMGLVLPL